jgi:hypothetical protein
MSICGGRRGLLWLLVIVTLGAGTLVHSRASACGDEVRRAECVEITPHRQPDFVYLENRCGRCIELIYRWQADGQAAKAERYRMLAGETTVVSKGAWSRIDSVYDCDAVESVE